MSLEDLAANGAASREPVPLPWQPRGLSRWLGALPSLCTACGMWQRAAVLTDSGGTALCQQCLPHGWVNVPLRHGAPHAPSHTSVHTAARTSAHPCAHQASHTPSISDAWAAVSYAAPWDRWVHALKFESAPQWAHPMAALCASATRARWGVEPASAPLESRAETILIPVPLGAQRLRERGYNQAWELARRMGAALRMPAVPNALLRLRETRAQSTLGRTARATNLADAFAVHPAHQRSLAGADVLLVDDVWTTGVTAQVCARLMLAAGASRVRVCVFAYSPPPDVAPLIHSREL